MMRVVAGRFGGRALVAPRGRSVRPTSDRVREAVFSILGSVEGASVLDLFAGSGALAVEALSRGAASATLVEVSAAAVAAIERNLRALGAEAEVCRMPALSFLERARRRGRQYDLVFVDPPYSQASALGPVLGDALVPVLGAGARVIAESDRRSPLVLEGFEHVDQRRYGDTLITIHHGPR